MSSKECIFKCEFCEKPYKALQNLRLHQSKIHGSEFTVPKRNKRNLTCPICHVNFENDDYIFHFKSIHDLTVTSESLKFPTLSDFNIWKENMEKDTKSKFISQRGSFRSSSHIKHYFACHRSGNFVSDSQGKRHIKIQGSKKINGFCPASIKVTENYDGNCNVEFVSTHVGHKNELSHLSLSNAERNMLASKLAAKIPLNVILDEVRDSLSNSELDRLHLLTRKDLNNIEKFFNLSGAVIKHKDDGTSVEAWVREVSETEESCE